MAIRFYLALRRSLMAGSVAAALIAMALVFAVIAAFSQMCVAAELDEPSAATAGSGTAALPASPASAPGKPGTQAGTAGQAVDANGQPVRAPGANPARPGRPLRVAAASQNESEDNAPHNAKPETPAIPVPPENATATQHSIRLGGRKIDYTATAGNLLLRDNSGQANASVFYIAYTVATKNPATRPVTFLFNGGPGAGTVFLMIGSFGPKRVRTASPANTPPAPYVLDDNPDSLLDTTDLVFIDAVGAGLSRIVGHGTGKDFWGVDKDLAAFSQFIDRYLTVNQRWNSPKYLLGESYGTARAAMLAYELGQNNISLNGVILMSSVLDSAAFSPGSDFQSESYLPSFAAVAWYHDKIVPKPANLPAFLDEARAFARGPYAQALAQGDALPDAQRDEIAARVAQFTGLDVDYVKRSRLRLYPSRFRDQLLRDRSRSVGRFDARFEGLEYDGVSERPDFDASVAGASSAFDAALHQHLAQDLHFTPADRYRVFNNEALTQWDWKHREWWGEHLNEPYAAGDLAEAMRQNPHLRVMSANGYFDLATPFYATEYALAHLGVDAQLHANVRIAYYPTGHMIYLDDAALHTLKRDLASFYAAGAS
ncbi:peptidase S10 [Paraburkholderia fungorum]|uniref:S10 family peptidase n=1 Tax=Paraburkholderia fungorum TaxID=134537 RepID=UPI000487A573|nr:peptidase S10 [Paraburkholderia fungorum]MBB5546187.1 carboxypeptidase C (cathepsin A) [Paraburkholderia fungorum]PNE54765.1 peptidase S10 [Paraburkholderia fungorum]